MIHRRRNTQPALPCPVDKESPAPIGPVLFGHERAVEVRRGAWVAPSLGDGLVGDELGLQHHAHRGVGCLDFVVNGGDTPLRERDEPDAPDEHRRASG